MLTTRPAVRLAVALALTASACSGSPSRPAAAPITVSEAAAVVREVRPQLRLGLIVDRTGPGATRELELVERIRDAIPLVDGVHSPSVEVASLEAAEAIGGAIDQLVEAGATVLVIGCDTGRLPEIIDEAAERRLLTVTGCASLPSPELDDRVFAQDPLFNDLADLDTVADAMAIHARQEGERTAAVLSSNLLLDVDGTCEAFEDEFDRRGGDVVFQTRFTGGLDAPSDVVDAATAAIADVDVIAVCALPGNVGPLIGALRASGLSQPVLTPWFAAREQWGVLTGDVRIAVPASPHGDDPNTVISGFVTGRPAEEAVLLDTLTALVQAADRVDSVGSRRLHTALRGATVDGATGPLSIDAVDGSVGARSWRIVRIDRGEPAFERVIRTD